MEIMTIFVSGRVVKGGNSQQLERFWKWREQVVKAGAGLQLAGESD